MPKLKEVMAALEGLAPSYLAEKWDCVGLMVGDPEAIIHHALCALDLNEEVVDEAIRLKANCIITHHPFFFKPMDRLDLSSAKGRLIKKLITHDIAVYAMHTNYDIAWGGLNDYLAEGLKLTNIEVLSPTYEETYCKVIIYVPANHMAQIRQVILEKGKTEIGGYKGCTFSVDGEGTFEPMEGSHPFIGQPHTLSKVNEKAVAFIALEREVPEIVAAIREVHPYEEMAYDVFKLENMKKTHGIGRVGKLQEPQPLGKLIEQIKEYFGITYLSVSSEDEEQLIESMAICSGEGSELIGVASKKAQLYLTGEVKFHQAQLAQSLGLVVVGVGHYASENRALAPIGECLLKTFSDCQVTYSTTNGETLFIR